MQIQKAKHLYMLLDASTLIWYTSVGMSVSCHSSFQIVQVCSQVSQLPYNATAMIHFITYILQTVQIWCQIKSPPSG